MARGVPFSELLKRIKDHEGECLDLHTPETLVLYSTIRCKKGHVWKANTEKIITGGWCPKCQRAKPQKLTIDDMKKIAQTRGGVCRSECYIDTQTKLE